MSPPYHKIDAAPDTDKMLDCYFVRPGRLHLLNFSSAHWRDCTAKVPPLRQRHPDCALLPYSFVVSHFVQLTV
eukprot:262405-Pleurochrysis_carterae.AAC.1